MHVKIKIVRPDNFVSGQNSPLDWQMTCSEKIYIFAGLLMLTKMERQIISGVTEVEQEVSL